MGYGAGEGGQDVSRKDRPAPVGWGFRRSQVRGRHARRVRSGVHQAGAGRGHGAAEDGIPCIAPGKVRDRMASGAVRPINRTRSTGIPRQQKLPDHAADSFPPTGSLTAPLGRLRSEAVVSPADPLIRGVVDAPY